MAWEEAAEGEEATEGERGVYAKNCWGWRCGNSMGGGYGGGARSEGTVRDGVAGDAEIGWEDATEGKGVGGYTVRDGGAGDAEIAWEATEGERGWRVKFACRWAQKNQTSEK